MLTSERPNFTGVDFSPPSPVMWRRSLHCLVSNVCNNIKPLVPKHELSINKDTLKDIHKYNDIEDESQWYYATHLQDQARFLLFIRKENRAE